MRKNGPYKKKEDQLGQKQENYMILTMMLS